jgi:hypothetical protein
VWDTPLGAFLGFFYLSFYIALRTTSVYVPGLIFIYMCNLNTSVHFMQHRRPPLITDLLAMGQWMVGNNLRIIWVGFSDVPVVRVFYILVCASYQGAKMFWQSVPLVLRTECKNNSRIEGEDRDEH